MYCLISPDRSRAPSAGPRLAVFLHADLARAYRESHAWASACEIAELPAIEVLKTMLRARQNGLAEVAVDPADDGGPPAAQWSLHDPWTAFVQVLKLEQYLLNRVRSEQVPASGFSDPRRRHERPGSLAPLDDSIAKGRSEYDAPVVDLTAAQLLSLAGSVELAKHAVDIAADFGHPHDGESV